MIEREKHIREIYDLNHRKDKLLHTGYDYETNLFDKSLSNVTLGNPTLKSFLDKLRKNTIYMIESNLLVRNFWNYTVGKYYNKHNN